VKDLSDPFPQEALLAVGAAISYGEHMKKMSPDDDDRIEDFLNRHGGPGPRGPREGERSCGQEGWSEIYAADGYTLRCDWSQLGSLLELKYFEKPP
jgi:hypothetical protein